MGKKAAILDKGGLTEAQKKLLLWTCFVSLVATSFAFIIRGFLADAWQVEFGLSETQKGEIMGAGLWPFGLSIVLFSLVIDRIGYGKTMIFAFACHLVAVILFFFAQGYSTLYWASLLTGLAAGTVEAVINPAIAAVFPKQKIKWLTILHAGWPGGLALNGILLLLLGEEGLNLGWRYRVFVLLIPVIAYGIMLLKTKFATSERVSAGVSYKEMLAEAGALSCLIVSYMVLIEIDRLVGRFGMGLLVETTFFTLPSLPMTILMVLITVGYYVYTRSLGRWMYVFLLFVMVLLATTELGTDGWIKDLMKPAMGALGLSGGWVLVYTSVIMTVLRFLIGPIQKGLGRISKVFAWPPAFLLLSSLLAAFGIFFLAGARNPAWILLTATIYGTGQCFFWPVTIGFAAERFPKGGALTINAIAGVGMLGVGIIGMSMLGFWQDKSIDRELLAKDKDAYERLMSPQDKTSIFGSYKPLDQDEINDIGDKLALRKFLKEEVKDLSADELNKNLKYKTKVLVAYDHLVQAETGAIKALQGYRKTAAEKTEPAPDAEELTATLAQDAVYQGIVRKAYDRLVRRPVDKTAESHGVMHAALEGAGILTVKPKEYGKQYEGKEHDGKQSTLQSKGVFIDADENKALGDDMTLVNDTRTVGKKHAMATVAILPVIMAVCYLFLIFYFRKKLGGYKIVDIAAKGGGKA